jgi:hypothetical protein
MVLTRRIRSEEGEKRGRGREREGKMTIRKKRDERTEKGEEIKERDATPKEKESN